MSITRHRAAAHVAADQIHPELAELGADRVSNAVARYAAATTRLLLAGVFLWAFIDKLFGLGKATPAAKAWIEGGSPTTGFLKGADGTFKEFFNSMAGVEIYDWLFMLGLAGIGTALLLGIGLRIAAVSGALMMVFMWAASLPLANNPFIDDHLVYAVVLVWLAAANAGRTAGIGSWWEKLAIVRRLPILR